MQALTVADVMKILGPLLLVLVAMAGVLVKVIDNLLEKRMINQTATLSHQGIDNLCSEKHRPLYERMNEHDGKIASLRLDHGTYKAATDEKLTHLTRGMEEVKDGVSLLIRQNGRKESA